MRRGRLTYSTRQRSVRAVTLLLTLGLVVGPTVGVAAAPSDGGGRADRGSSLPTKNLAAYRDTYWYVPRKYLTAYQYTSGGQPAVRRVSDQTLWHFTKARGGYLFGCSYQSIDRQSWSPATIVGSVTPDNSVVIGFNAAIDVVGHGSLIEGQRRSHFLMQMSTGSRANGVNHWAYMVQATPGSRAWQRLPGTGGQSVRDVATGC